MPRIVFALAMLFQSLFIAVPGWAAPKVIVISLDGATPRLVNRFLATGVLPKNKGLGLLARQGVSADQNFTVAPSLTAVGHIAIATGSTAAKNDIPSNTFHLVASPFASNISGFGAPTGGYSLVGPGPSTNPTAVPLWKKLREAGKVVVTATWPGGDGVDVLVPGLTGSPIIQPHDLRTVDYTVPFGEFGGVGGRGFTLTTGDFGPAPSTTLDQLTAAGKNSFSPVLQKLTELETFSVGGVSYTIQVAALDTTNDHKANYDTLVFFDSTNGIQPGPFALPATGPAYAKANGKSSQFYLVGSPKKAGTAFFITLLTPDLSTVHIARYSAADIPPNAPVQSVVDDINTHVGFWLPQADFRFPERLNPGLTDFSDLELEALYEDQVTTFVDYQTRVALRAMERNPNADLMMIYIEQPDGSEHQFLLVDPRQASNPLDPTSIFWNQDWRKVARYQKYVEKAYQTANNAVQRIVAAAGIDKHGRPKSNVIVVSDHGFDPFHTAVNITNLLAGAGIPSTKVRAITSGPAVNLYINLAGREPNGTVTAEEYVTLRQQLVELLRGFKDTNGLYTFWRPKVPVFDKVFARPIPADVNDPSLGRGTSEFIGQDSGDVFAMMTSGYNFDGTQSPVVQRQGDEVSTTPVFSVPNFYGAHGYDPKLEHMSAIFFAAGPDVKPGSLRQVHNIDVAPTIDRLLCVEPEETVEGKAISRFFERCAP